MRLFFGLKDTFPNKRHEFTKLEERATSKAVKCFVSFFKPKYLPLHRFSISVSFKCIEYSKRWIKDRDESKSSGSLLFVKLAGSLGFYEK